ncbi:hypothetical protein V2J09_013861 [Rumex salicifolius]
MALEAVIFPQDPFIGCYFKDLISSYGSLSFDPCGANPQLLHHHNNNHQDLGCAEAHDLWDHQYQHSSNSSSPPLEKEGCTATVAGGDEAAAGRRKRRRRSGKNKEEAENQRMTHIAVERNRRKQMNEYLAVIRSLMPPSYVQRGDQASIIGGAINYVKELEQLLQSLEVQKTTNTPSPKQQQQQGVGEPEIHVGDDVIGSTAPRAPFAEFFSFPQYSRRRGDEAAAAEELEVSMADGHANLKILLKRKPKQLLKLVAGFQAIRLSVLHVNVTTLDASLALYTFSLKVEEGCHVNSVEEIAGAANHIVGEPARIQ